MDHAIFDAGALKKPVNVSVNSDLLAQARALKLNLSQALEAQLVKLVTEGRRNAWKQENRQAISEYNERIAREGVFGDENRLF